MKKFLLTMFLTCWSVLCFGQNWSETNLITNPLTQKSIKEYVYEYDDSSTKRYTVRLSPVFDDVVLLETNEPIGRFRMNIFRHSITAKVSVFLYDQYERKIWRNKETVGLGMFNTNKDRKFASLKCEKLYDYLMEGNGYAVIYYTSLLTGEDVSILVPCINYGN